MFRALTRIYLALFLIAFATAPALAKPMIAVLGLEVVDPSGTPSAQDTQVAKELTDGLRARAKAGTGTYQLAPGSDKELIDQKLLNNCDTEAAGCMSAIGNQLGAEVLMYGKLQKDSKGYQVTLKVLDVGRKSVQKSSTDLIPVNESSGAPLQGWAKKIYAKLTGEQSSGTLVVKLSNAERGTILIDGEEKGNITNGTGQVAGLSEGKYKLTVESDGFRRYERDITVSGGKTENVAVTLESGSGTGGGSIGGGGVIGPSPGPGPGPEGGSGNGMWKGVFVGSMVVAAAGGGWWAYNWTKINKENDYLCTRGQVSGDCTPNNSNGSVTAEQHKAAVDRGNSAKTQTWVGGAVMGVGLGVAAFAFYKGFIAKPNQESSTSAAKTKRGKRVRRERFIVTPIVAPDGGGATVRLDW